MTEESLNCLGKIPVVRAEREVNNVNGRSRPIGRHCFRIDVGKRSQKVLDHCIRFELREFFSRNRLEDRD